MKLLILFSMFLFINLTITNGKSNSFRDQYRDFVKNVATTFHRNWCQNYRIQNANVKHRFKLTRYGNNYDSSDFIYPMIFSFGSCLVHRNLKVARDRYNSSITYVDILNMNYDELPDDWAFENRANALVACRLVTRAVEHKHLLNRNFIENMSDKVHRAWMKRNSNRTEKQQMLLSYKNLPETEKAKDRRAILIACHLFNELALYRHFNTTPIHLPEY